MRSHLIFLLVVFLPYFSRCNPYRPQYVESEIEKALQEIETTKNAEKEENDLAKDDDDDDDDYDIDFEDLNLLETQGENEDYETDEPDEFTGEAEEDENEVDENTENDSGDEEGPGEGKGEESTSYESLENVNADVIDKIGEIHGQHSGDVVGDGDIMMVPGEQEAEFDLHPNEEHSLVQVKDEELLNGISTVSKRWKSGYVPYVIHSSLGKKAKGAISQAISEYNKKTCIRLRKRKSQKDYIRFYKGTGSKKGCWSYVGRRGGRQDISLSSGCEWKKTVIHEIMHALGFWHEQSRPDRNSYVTINWHNIRSKDKKKNFETKKKVTYLGHKYDYKSIMHYGRTAFGKLKNGKRLETITPKASHVTLGQCKTCSFSTTDASQIISLYCQSRQSKVPKYSTLNKEIKMMMAAFYRQSNSQFRHTLRKHLAKRYYKHYWTVSSYNSKPARSHHFRGFCGHAFNHYKKNVVACFHRKKVKVPSKKRMESIAKAVKKHIENRGCNMESMRNRAWKKARSYGYDIAMIHTVRHGMNLRVAWKAFTYFFNFKCSKSSSASLVVMFGKP